MEIESWFEDTVGEVKGEFQGGKIDVIPAEEVEYWKIKMQEVLK